MVCMIRELLSERAYRWAVPKKNEIGKTNIIYRTEPNFANIHCARTHTYIHFLLTFRFRQKAGGFFSDVFRSFNL